MNFHLFSIILIYLFCILIIHILLKYSSEKNDEIDLQIEEDNFSKKNIEKTKNLENNEIEIKNTSNPDDLILNNDELLNLSLKKEDNNFEIIDDLDENKAKNDLIDYLNFENDVSYHFLDNEQDIKGTNFYTDSNNSSKFKSDDEKIDKFFNQKNDTDIYSFDPVPTNSYNNVDNNNNTDNKIFNNVEAFDDLDMSYAQCF